MALLRTLEMLKTGERINDLLYRRTTSASRYARPAGGTSGAGSASAQLLQSWTGSGSHDLGVFRMSPAAALR